MKNRRPLWRQRLIAIVLIFMGAVMSVYPVVENLYNDWRGSAVVDEYTQRISAAPAPILESQQQAAEQYNDALTISALNDPWSDEQEATSPEHDAYVGELAGFGPLGRIRVPSVEIDLPIFHDATRRSLGLGAGHMYGTSLPIGGPGTHAVIAGHTGSTERTYFNRLNEVGEGTLFHIDTLGRTLTYRVDQITVVSMSDLSQIQPVEGADLVTLVTCIVGSSGERLLVRGVREPTSAADTAHGTDIEAAAQVPAETPHAIQRWMRPRLAIAAGALVLLFGMTITWLVSDTRAVPSVGAGFSEPAQPTGTKREDAQV